jgi:hypothetical protein
VPIHPICHRALHAHMTNAELARTGGKVEQLRERPVIARFVTWIADKPPDFHARTAKPATRGRRA